MKSLFELYREHQGKVSDKWAIYLSEYDRLFSGYRDQPVRMLEIGIQNGGSLEIWSKYFPNAHALVGCDINPDCAKLTYDDPRIKVVVGDANTDASEKEILSRSPNFDLIIDDGSHTSGDIVKSFARYFSHLDNGGIFVAEDLHCSYWSNFEGGLYYPYSSIAFFKRLADVVNHEHWGIEKERKRLLQGFAKQFATDFDESDLRAIHSIEFFNSVCVVHKKSTESNVLGERFVAGRDEAVILGLQGLVGHSLTQSQSFNPWANMTLAPEEDWERLAKALFERDAQIVERDAQIVERDAQIVERDAKIARLVHEVDALRNSTSWRVTKPLRFIKHQIARGKHLVRIAPATFRLCGGPRATLKRAMDLYRREGFAGVKRGIRLVQTGSETMSAVGSGEFDRNDYAEWVRRYDTIDDAKRQKLRALCDCLASKPKISIVMPTYNPKPEWLIEAIESVRRQIYPNWELCIADDASPDAAIRPILERYVREDERIKVVFREQNGHISAASNSALEIATGKWVALLDHDDLLTEDALFWIADSVNSVPGARLIYSDEDKINFSGARCEPFFKPDWSPHLACSQAYLGHLVVFNIEDGKPSFDKDCVGAQDYDLWLSLARKLQPQQIVHVSKILYHWRKHFASTASNPDSKSYADDAGLRAVNKFVSGYYPDLPVVAKKGDGMFTYRLVLPLSQDVLFSIIIPTRDRIDLLSICVSSIIEKSTWKNFEIIILDNNSSEQETFDYFSNIQRSDARVRVVEAKIDFNWSKLNNIGIAQAKGDIYVFLNNDTSVIAPDWLECLGVYASLPDVAVVGGLLLFEDKTIQHSGVVVGMGGWADHVYRNRPLSHASGTGFVSPLITRDVLAVTGACMAISKNKLNQLGGFDEDFIICGSDVEICIRAYNAGFFNVMCADARLYHYESKTRSPFVPDADFDQSKLKYAPFRIERTDPFYNRNLSLGTTSPGFKEAPRAA